MSKVVKAVVISDQMRDIADRLAATPVAYGSRLRKWQYYYINKRSVKIGVLTTEGEF